MLGLSTTAAQGRKGAVVQVCKTAVPTQRQRKDAEAMQNHGTLSWLVSQLHAAGRLQQGFFLGLGFRV